MICQITQFVGAFERGEISVSSGVYEIKNTVNGHVYIGSSKNLESRRYNHFRALRRERHTNPHLQAAFNKYGENAFNFTVLLRCDEGELLAREQELLDARKPEYNIGKVAGRERAGAHHTHEAREKMSEANKGRASWIKGKHLPDETREKLSEIHKGKPGPFKGHHHTPETRERISKAQKGKPRPHRGNKGQTPWNKGHHLSDETREQISKKLKGRHLSDETREKLSLAMQGNQNGKRKPLIRAIVDLFS